MKSLKEIINNVIAAETIGELDIAVSSVCFDSRKVEAGSLFVAVKGTSSDGHVFIEQTIENGAVAIVCEELPELRSNTVTYIKVKNSSLALGIIASNFYDNPSRKLKLVGVTGTN